MFIPPARAPPAAAPAPGVKNKVPEKKSFFTAHEIGGFRIPQPKPCLQLKKKRISKSLQNIKT
jgi:hypothetical protein